MKTIADRLKAAREWKGWKQAQLATAADVSTGTIGNIEAGIRLSKGSIPQIAEALGVNYKWLATGAGEMIDVATSDQPLSKIEHSHAAINDVANTIQVPLLENSGSMGEGEAMLDGDVLAGQLTLNPAWVSSTLHPSRQDALRFIHGYGDSMTPTFNSGDVLLVDTGITEVKIDGVYVLFAHDRLFIKRVRQRMDGVFEISSDNPTHKTVDVLNGSHEVTVRGRVIWVWNGRRT